MGGPTKVTLQELVDNWTAVDHLAPSTVHRMASTLHTLFQYTVDDKKRLAETGRRWGEYAGMTLGDLDLGVATLKVALQLDRGQALSPTKNKTSGAFDLSDAMVKEPSSRRVPLPARRREVEASPGGCVCRRWSLQPALELCGP